MVLYRTLCDTVFTTAPLRSSVALCNLHDKDDHVKKSIGLMFCLRTGKINLGLVGYTSFHKYEVCTSVWVLQGSFFCGNCKK